MNTFKLIAILVVFLISISGCTSNKIKVDFLNNSKPCNIFFYEHKINNRIIYKKLYEPHSVKIQQFLNSYKDIEFIYFTNIKGVEPEETIFITRHTAFRTKYAIDTQCSLEEKRFIKYDAFIDTSLETKTGLASLESKITLSDGSTHTIYTELKHNYRNL